MLTSIIEEQSLGAAFPFIVAGAQSDRVDVARVILFLRMNRGVAVDLGGGRPQNFGLHPLGEAQHVNCPVHAHLRGLNRIELIVNRGGWAGQVEDFINLYIEGKADVVPGQLESRIREEMVHVVPSSGIEIVDAKHFVAPLEQPRTQMRADESSSAGNKDASFG
jgi:hypothetical protein